LGNERRGLLDKKDWCNLSQADSEYRQLVQRTKYLLTVDFRPLQLPHDTTMPNRKRSHKIE
jgi:hypothetical protein